MAMHHYSDEVTEQSGRHGRLRWLTLGISTAIIVAALWAAGFPPVQWLSRLDGLIHSPPPAAVQEPGSATITALNSELRPLPTQDSGALSGTESSLSKVPLSLYLISVAPGRNVAEGTAQIGTSIENPQTYGAGALLANGATLAELHGDHVVLMRDGRSAKLFLYNPLKGASPSKGLNDMLTVGGEPPTVSAVEPTRELFTDYIRPTPVYDGETLVGMQVYPGRQSSVFTQMGLQPGDIITAVNDAPFADPAQAMMLFDQLAEGVVVVATLQRKQATQRIALDGASIVDAEARREDQAGQTVANATSN